MDQKESILTFPSLYKETVSKFGNNNAYAFVGEKPIDYNEAYQRINAISSLLGKAGIKKGDRVALLSANMPNWAIAYFGITFMGAVVVPILPDFSLNEVSNVLTHSEAKMIFISSHLIPKLDRSCSDNLQTAIVTDDFSILFSNDESLRYNPTDVPSSEFIVNEEDIASIVYTSGTTGRSKGVMLTHKNICFNALKGWKLHQVEGKDTFLSLLPLSHTYENTLGLILPMIGASCVYYLRKPPTPSVLLPALKEVRPTTILSVPLIIEKIYFGKIMPTFNKNIAIRAIYKVPFFRKRLNKVAGKKLLETFGGNLRFFGVGGAKLNTTIERFLNEAGFPYAIGYGLTETSPLIAGTSPFMTTIDSTGPAIEGVQVKINEPDHNGEGEIWVKSPSVMKGYYKEPEMTTEVITEDGWFRTGDLGVIDSKSNLFIKGRLKNMIVGSSGENIYPEEIESVINNFKFVVESLVVQKKGKLVAMVHINMEEFENKYAHLKDIAERFEEKKSELVNELKEYVNINVSKYCRIYQVELQPVPFQKTATQKIKRFMYNN
jgi:long-chain acyl-CoA synthetase